MGKVYCNYVRKGPLLGKTTTTANVGAGLSQLGNKVVVINTGADLTRRFGCGNGIGESDRL